MHPSITISVLTVCRMVQRECWATRLMSVSMPDGRVRIFSPWLSDGMASGRITVNQPDSRVHSVAGFIYLLVPDIFFLFLKDTGSDSHREQIQTSFEKLQLHRVRKGERFTRAKLYCSEDKQGRFSKVNGYLIKAARLKGMRPPEDSKLLFFP